MNYVAGFLFRRDRKSIVLIQKNKPEWQKGKLNGVGGKIESGETPGQAMTREFYEETGAFIGVHRWENFMQMSGPGWSVHFFYAVGDEPTETKTHELVVDKSLPLNPSAVIVANLSWAIPMALDHLLNSEGPKYALVRFGEAFGHEVKAA